ncbi:uncharacterized protein K444DRAFT_271227 [Hyaloscypha bicolor E]|uniref:Uncharacterized protein n=1 Tax=Hyaloscypha bicolor E TaxID=1095630 RepID=A0A2J6SID5_9HELO|nr:uncharacterized protein K444DRAFT_271227 [Hyaloscypha bicolor E]PMD50536.1 hypothetical protein K444DRAFT_271227 [Hyaloscypha bicolor E]
MTTVATRGNVLCTNYQQSGNTLVPNRCYSSTPLEAAPAVFVNATHRFLASRSRPSKWEVSNNALCHPFASQYPISAAPTDYVHGPRLSTASASLDPDLPVAVGRKKEHHVRPRMPIARPLVPWQRPCTAAHRRSAALRWPCSDRSSADSWAVGACSTQRAANAAFHRSLSARVFSRREYVCAYVAVKKTSSIFPRQKQALGVCRVGGPPPLGYFYLKDLWWPETDGF